MRFDHLGRREFITLLGGATAWPLAAGAQQGERMRRIGMLMASAESDQEGQARVTAFREGLQKLGWAEGHNIRIDYRWTTPGDAEATQRFAKELVALQPDLILSNPAVYPFRFFAELGGLLSYGVDLTDNFRRAAPYADRILKGAKPSELPVQAPVKFELVINLKTAKALGLTVPQTLQVAADKVIE
jgi:hypothetical protein